MYVHVCGVCFSGELLHAGKFVCNKRGRLQRGAGTPRAERVSQPEECAAGAAEAEAALRGEQEQLPLHRLPISELHQVVPLRPHGVQPRLEDARQRLPPYPQTSQ